MDEYAEYTTLRERERERSERGESDLAESLNGDTEAEQLRTRKRREGVLRDENAYEGNVNQRLSALMGGTREGRRFTGVSVVAGLCGAVSVQ